VIPPTSHEDHQRPHRILLGDPSPGPGPSRRPGGGARRGRGRYGGFLGLSEADLTPAGAGSAEDPDGRDRRPAQRGRPILKFKLGEAQNLADLDVLAPVLNRRAFLREIKRVAAFAQRYGSPASLVFFDLDGFKAVNDRFGHAAGDEALQGRRRSSAGQCPRERRGGPDRRRRVRRAAGPGRPADRPSKAETLAAAVRDMPVQVGEWSAPLRISWGVREIEAGADPEVALAEADAAMFLKKRPQGSIVSARTKSSLGLATFRGDSVDPAPR
jgi:GGDEF domain-containing protein